MSPVTKLKHAPLSPEQAWATVGGLSKPSKMPGWAYGIPARECKTGATLVDKPGSTCSGCYALKGNYRFGNVQKAQYRRFESLAHPRWVEAMTVLLCGTYGDSGVFRWHDSGDLQSVDHLYKIALVADATPHIKHWLPTREYAIVDKYLEDYTLPPNLCVRLSAHYVDRPAGLGGYRHLAVLPTSTVHCGWGQPVVPPSGIQRESIECKAYTRGNECGPCRACWTPEVKNVSYPKH